MQWALLAVILIGLFMISGRFPKLAFTIFGVLVTGLVITLMMTSKQADVLRNEMSENNITFENMTVVPAYGGSYRITGRLSNSHENAEMREVTLGVSMLDCQAESTNCQIVGQASERVGVRIPPGQARDFSVNIYFGEPRIGGEREWRFNLTNPRG